MARSTWGVMLTLLAAGCTSHVHYPYRVTEHAERQPSGGPSVIQYDPQPITYRNSVLVDDPALPYQVRHIKMRSSGENGQTDNRLEALYYRSNQPGKLPLVIVLPIWGGSTYPPMKFVSALSSRSRSALHVLRVLGEDYVFDWDALGAARTETAFLQSMERMVLRDVANAVDVGRLIDWAEAHPEVDPARIGMIAFSHSAVVGGAVVVNEPRLEASVLIMGGVYVHRILAVCGGRIGRLRETITERFGWTRDDYERALEPIFMPYDLTRFPGRADPSRVLMIDAGKDDCIPQDSREDMWVALGRPERYSLNYRHKSSFLAMTPLGFYWMREKVYDFLATKLEVDEAPH